MATLISVDVEADGQIPYLYSMVSFGAVVVDSSLDKTFYAETKPISDKWDPKALAVSGFSREQHEGFEDPSIVMTRFAEWIKSVSNGKPIFISDNNGFDWQWINFYFHYFTGENPFGWSSRRIGDLYCGFSNDLFAGWKHLRTIKHTHNALQDAMANATALLEMKKLGLKLPLK